jgi:hypothetical protein
MRSGTRGRTIVASIDTGFKSKKKVESKANQSNGAERTLAKRQKFRARLRIMITNIACNTNPSEEY